MPPRRKAPPGSNDGSTPAATAAKRKASTIDSEVTGTSNSTTDQNAPAAPAAATNKEKVKLGPPLPPQSSSSSNNAHHHHHNSNSSDFVLQKNTDSCLHCQSITTNIQVRCDECSAYICNVCHWCHEYQANHEIRVCDRCDAFYCRNCDDMDQCDDCGEVVCAGCSTLLSCKFCGGGLCEDCATACGRCGIVLCSRDAKFAVDCDTCRLSYCLVCLASGSKDSCVRCGHRPSKRMEQLVHLRLKSIYKAFKQSSNGNSAGRNLNTRGRQNDDGTGDDTGENAHAMGDDPQVLLQAAASAANAGSSSKSRRRQRSPFNEGSEEAPESLQDKMEQYMAEKEKADAAAAELIAELEEEEEATRKKKNKKKKAQKKKPHEMYDMKDSHEAALEAANSESSGRGDSAQSSNDELGDKFVTSPRQLRTPPRTWPTPEIETPKTDDGKPTVDPMEQVLCELVAQSDVEGLEDFLSSVKGIPGKAIIRKNAKKALKRLRSGDDELDAIDRSTEHNLDGRAGSETPVDMMIDRTSDLVKIVSHSHGKLQTQTSGSSQRRAQATTTIARSECVMHMVPSIVGWVIGKGGQRIRDLMEESGARIWIDQESMTASEPRIVYISGPRKSVDIAVKLVTELVSKAPVGTPVVKSMTPVMEGVSVRSPVMTSKGPPSVPDASDLTTPAGIDLKPRGRLQNSQGRKNSAGAADRTVQVITCDPRFVPLLIGRRGWTIKNIQDTSGARVDIDQTVTPRVLSISGSEDQVIVAAKMVNDVLNYPQSQLQGGPEYVSGNEESNPSNPNKVGSQLISPVQGARAVTLSAISSKPPHSSPPSSLIMPEDTVSASSSLSSTPEPSSASVSTRGMPYSSIPTGPMLPPSMSLTAQQGMYNHGSSGAQGPNEFQRILPQTSLRSSQILPPQAATTHGSFFGVGNLALGQNLVQDLSVGSALAEGGFSSQQPMTGSFGNPFVERMHETTGNAASAQSLHMKSQSQGLLLPLQQPKVDPLHAPGIWPVPSGPTVSQHYQSRGHTVSEGFHLDAAVEFLQHSTQPGLSAPSAAPGGTTSSSFANSGLSGADDSLIVDSLFGPSDNMSGASALLSGLQGLSIGKETHSNSDIWGSVPAPEQQYAAPPRGAWEGRTETAAPSPPLFEPSQPNASHSRFAWGGYGNG